MPSSQNQAAAEIMPAPIFMARGLTKVYRSGEVEVRALAGVDLDLFPGAPQWGKAQLECAVKVLGGDRILYGGSYPIRRDWFQEGVAS